MSPNTFFKNKYLRVQMAKIPTNATRAFKGILYDVYHFEQTMFDGSTKTFEMLKRKPSVQVIPIKDGKVVMALEEQPGSKEFATFIGGGCEEEEDPIAAAKRELLEETGFESNDWELLFTLKIPGRIEWDIHFYAARACKKVQDPKLDSGEKIKLLELSFEEFLEFTQRDDFRSKIYTSYIAGSGYDQEKVKILREKLFSRKE